MIPAHEREAVRRDLIRRLEALTGPDGRPMGNRAHRPEDLYAETRGVPPDLLVVLGDYSWRAAGQAGGELFLFENDTGPDDANHEPAGIIIGGVTGRALPTPDGGRILTRPLDIRQVAPTILHALGLEGPADLSVGPVNPWTARG